LNPYKYQSFTYHITPFIQSNDIFQNYLHEPQSTLLTPTGNTDLLLLRRKQISALISPVDLYEKIIDGKSEPSSFSARSTKYVNR